MRCTLAIAASLLATAGAAAQGAQDVDYLRGLGMFFFVGAALAKDETQRSRYEQIGERAKEVTVDRKELEAVC